MWSFPLLAALEFNVNSCVWLSYNVTCPAYVNSCYTWVSYGRDHNQSHGPIIVPLLRNSHLRMLLSFFQGMARSAFIASISATGVSWGTVMPASLNNVSLSSRFCRISCASWILAEDKSPPLTFWRRAARCFDLFINVRGHASSLGILPWTILVYVSGCV